MQKETDILEAHQARMGDERLYQGESLLLVHDFVCYVTEGSE